MNREELVETITREVVDRLKRQEAGGSGPGGSGSRNGGSSAVRQRNPAVKSEIAAAGVDLARYVDHTLLKPEATAAQIDKLVAEAKQHNFRAVCVNGSWTERCAQQLRGTNVSVAVVVGFPLGAMASRIKAAEARLAIEEGADEIDMVLNIGALKGRDLDTVRKDILSVTRVTGTQRLTKVIIEAALLTDEEKVLACEIAEDAGADFVKTSTGFSKGGATVHDVALMRKTVSSTVEVKAAGGIRSRDDAVAMIEAGATRLGTSAGIAIVSGGQSAEAY
ncbi:MAG: deoxyribose-phosphate aldolase [Spirochaetaceae bacterium]